MSTCNSCGDTIPNDVSFCAGCGAVADPAWYERADWWKRVDNMLIGLAVTMGVAGVYCLILGVQGSTPEGAEAPVMSFANALLGIGLIAGGCLIAIIARIRQAERHHKEALRERD